MCHFETVEAESDEVVDLLPSHAAARRMRKYRNSAGTMHDADHLFGADGRFGDERRPPDTDEAPEGLVDGRGGALLYQGPGDVGPTDASVTGGGFDGCELHPDAEIVEAIDDLAGALVSKTARLTGALDEPIIRFVDEEAEHMDLAVAEVGREFDPRNDLEVEIARRGARRGDAADDVVVGDGESDESDAIGLGDELLRCQHAVRVDRMRVQLGFCRIRDGVSDDS